MGVGKRIQRFAQFRLLRCHNASRCMAAASSSNGIAAPGLFSFLYICANWVNALTLAVRKSVTY